MKGLCLPSGDVTPLTMWWGPWLWGHNAGDGGRVTLVGTGDTLVGAWCCVTLVGTHHPSDTLLGTRGLSPLWGQGTPWWGCGVVTAFCGAWGTSVAFGDTPGAPCDIWVQSLETFMAIGNTLCVGFWCACVTVLGVGRSVVTLLLSCHPSRDPHG